ncbi:hypothetical protein AK812_SmicGene7815 [Symbiodinium microadriaticum]|uniref:Uncharacterized protein n=1 Tax=Symbiodinium microadriaticum TaxID=2951 RepID=A0A1Q9EMM6_SYMMI|nr:hypothetical protein AK812_SmicGene7815 [Symbiodinium microadriaticum]
MSDVQLCDEATNAKRPGELLADRMDSLHCAPFDSRRQDSPSMMPASKRHRSLQWVWDVRSFLRLQREEVCNYRCLQPDLDNG